VQEVIPTEKKERDLHSFYGRDLLAKLEEIRSHVDRIAGEHNVEAGQLSQLVVGILNALVNLGMLPIQDIPQLSKSAEIVLTAAGLLL
jgi:exosome complex RNA-binding protein Csl4